MCGQGNVVLWKPSDTAMSASYAVYKILRESGLPPNIIQFVPADGPVFGDMVTSSEHLAGINFTGSVPYDPCLFFVFLSPRHHFGLTNHSGFTNFIPSKVP